MTTPIDRKWRAEGMLQLVPPPTEDDSFWEAPPSFGAEYRVWVLQASFAQDSGDWDGCTAPNICRATCASIVGIRRLQNWINEIHRWACRYMRLTARPM